MDGGRNWRLEKGWRERLCILKDFENDDRIEGI